MRSSWIHHSHRHFLTAVMALISILILISIAIPTSAGDVILSNNQDSGNSVWFISGERSLVMNGFDLTPLNLTFPVSVDRVSISVVTPQPGAPVDIAIYQDANGGSPVDATLLRQQRVDIQQSGLFTYTFDDPVVITQPVVWIGFYLPVDFEFRADTSGSSVLTYWAWTSGTTFGLDNLANAGVIGPADGSAPVNLDMDGIARITAELATGGQQVNVTSTPSTSTSSGGMNLPSIYDFDNDEPIRQIVGDSTTSLAPLVSYGEDCINVYYDSFDISSTYRNGIRWFCKLDNPAFTPENPDGYLQRGLLYDLTAFGVNSPGTKRLPYSVTHCIAPSASDLNTAVIGLGYGAPRQWEILPTVRFGSIICAEARYSGYISYFVPN